MREITVRLKFTSHCLGNVKKHYQAAGKMQDYYTLPRNPEGKVIFMPTWWGSTLRRAAAILCRHQDEVDKVRFALEVDGNPQQIPKRFFKRYYGETKFSKHEAFFPGDIISVTCAVPDSISDDDFHRLLTYAGKYCGMSPGHSNKYGFYVVESLRPTVPKNKQRQDDAKDHGRDAIAKKEPSTLGKEDGSKNTVG